MPDSSIDSQSTYLSLVTEDDSPWEERAYRKIRDGTDRGGGQRVICKKKWRQRDEWRTNFVREVRATILQHQRACNKVSLTVPQPQDGLCSRRVPTQKLISQAVGKVEETAKPLVDLSGDGTYNLLGENMVLEATIDKDMLPVTKVEGFCFDGKDDPFPLWLAGLDMASHVEAKSVNSQPQPSKASDAHDTRGLLTYKKSRRQPKNLRFRFV